MIEDRRYTTLQKVVADVLNDMGMYDTDNYLRFIRFASRGFQKLKLFHLNSHKTIYLTADDETNIIKLPTDFVDYVRIGVCENSQTESSNTIWTLTLNEDLCFPRDIVDGQDFNSPAGVTSADEISIYGYPWLYPYYDAKGGRNSLYMRLDRNYNRIIVQGVIQSYQRPVLEYISTGVSADGNTYIPIVATEALISFIHWKRKQNSTGFTQYDKEAAKNEWMEEVAQLEEQQYSFTYDEFLDVLYSSYTQSIKR